MSRADAPLIVHVFLASPGDVPEERAYAREYLESILPNDPLLEGRARFEVVSWDHPHASTPMPAHLTPQEAVIRYKRRPANCDVAVVILAGRLGTHLSLDALQRPDGSAYQSGTEWEYEDAWNASPRPDILIFRRMDVAPIDVRDPHRKERLRQYELVEQFFEQFINPDGSLKGGYQQYTGIDGFKAKFANDVKHVVQERLRKTAPPDQPQSDSARIVAPDRCLGRATEIATLTTALTERPAATVLVLGGPGIGKTTLTRQLATSTALTERFADRCWFVELETATDAASLRTAIVQALGLDPASPSAFNHALATLREAPALLVLDNLETPWEADMAAVHVTLRQLAALPSLTLLASVRGSEAPDSPAWSHVTELAPLPREAARRLFRTIARKISATDPLLERFLDELGDVPLAVELIARQAEPDATLARLWDEWRRRGIALAVHPNLPAGRRSSVLRSIDLSLHSTRLRDDGQFLFRLLGASPAGMAPPDRASLLGDAANSATRQLLATGLAVERGDRLDLLPPVRDAARRLTPLTEAETDRWCRHYLGLARKCGDQIGMHGGAEAAARLIPDGANVEAAFVAASTTPTRSVAVAAVEGLVNFVLFTGLGSGSVLDKLAAACRTANDAVGETWCLLGSGAIARVRGDHDAAMTAYTRALPIAQQARNPLCIAICYQRLGVLASDRFRFDEAREFYESAQKICRDIGATSEETYCLWRLAEVSVIQFGEESSWGDKSPDEVRSMLENALSRYEEDDNKSGMANCYSSLAEIDLLRGTVDGALEKLQIAFQLYKSSGHLLGMASCELAFGDIVRIRNADLEEARNHWVAALSLSSKIKEPQGIGDACFRLAEISEGAERAAHLSAAREAWRSIDRPDLIAKHLDPLG